MTAVLPREQAVVCALDHLHTRTPTPTVGYASIPLHRRSARWFARGTLALLTSAAVVLAVAPAGAAADPAQNAVQAFGGAPALGPAPGLDLNVGLSDITPTPTGGGYWLLAPDGGVFSFGDAQFRGSTGNLALNAPVVSLAATPTAGGYWLVGADGGVFSFGDAPFLGSMGAAGLVAPILAIVATPTGHGYWLIGADGGVFAFGDAPFYGSAVALRLGSPVIAAAPTPSGRGYWLLAADGGVFAFGDAGFLGAAVEPGARPAVGITAAPDGSGYLIARDDGTVRAFGTSTPGAPGDPLAASHPTVGIAARRGGGYWTVQSAGAPAPATLPELAGHPFLACTRAHESDTSGGYRAVSPGGMYRGAYQFSRATWNTTAQHAGRNDLVGIDPAAAAPADQDFLAYDLYRWQGRAPWGGRCAGL